MVTEVTSRLVTADELLQLSKDEFYGELIRGVLVEQMPPGMRHGKIVALITYLLCAFVIPRKLGTVASGAPGVVLERDPDTVRGPDIAFFSAQSVPLDADIPGFMEVTPTLVVEVGSPGDSMPDREKRARMWVDYGVPLVWIAHPEAQRIDIYRPGTEVESLTATDHLTGRDAMPGFYCSVSEMFDVSR